MAPVSTFFNNFQASNESELLNSLIVESIRIYGCDMYYVPRELVNYDKLYGTDDSSRYDDAILIEMYVKNNQGFLGNKDFISKIAGVTIDDEMLFTVSRTVFEEEVGTARGFVRPREGDLIFFPLNNKAFEITFVEKYEMFYPLGALYTWDISCKLFQYSGEKIETGLADIDALQERSSLNVYDYAVRTEVGEMIMTEDDEVWITEDFLPIVDPLADNSFVSNTANIIIDWDEEDPMAEFGKVV